MEHDRRDLFIVWSGKPVSDQPKDKDEPQEELG